MLKTKVLAMDIENLSDARYFAAWGVDFLSFNAKELTREEITEMIQWVEGPAYLLSNVGASDTHENIPGIVGVIEQPTDKNDFLVSKIDFYGADKTMKIIYLKDKGQLPDTTRMGDQQTLFFESRDPLSVLDQIVKLNASAGIVLRGGKEESVGLKTFETLDEVLEALQVEQ